MHELRIVDVGMKDPDLLGLIGKLDAYLYALYPPEEVFGVDLDDPDLRDIHFAAAYLDGQPAGCGAIKELDGTTTELKRFYVEPEFRNRGVAGRMLRYLEDKARARRYAVIRLETGGPQFEAVAFYKKHGYAPIEPYGEYIGCPSSLCFEKRLEG
ncbi:GNAT family N-acetyltransferase [Paenibacillus sp. MWE-103]|uniref:GNAT family N-acetyltransferase n=1 Tax=Paenibacillus artemisiicola TaxID=1172618 RepID=A0ABS3W8X6_9BACL|nr:GNAT family N-acetyltransferase [Paenibacillus artemisiicola]MBO7744774.1 GNAT family N-acetyltransferase [Paenibacillus artemisiicola]